MTTIDVLDAQLRANEPLDADELRCVRTTCHHNR
jgi:hypothetical protein